MGQEINSKISIIIPVYNAEAYLGDCLDSVIYQTYKNIEILCINDGSTDSSYEILKKYAAKDSRILLFTQENKGPAAARNIGLENATGEYIMFCDADDSYEPTMCQEMLKTIIKEDVDMVMCNANGYDLNYGSYYFNNKEGKQIILDKSKVRMNVFLWNKIFKKELLGKYKISFPTGHNSEDNYFIYAYISILNSIYYLDKKLINHFERKNSIMDLYRNNIKFDNLMDKIYFLEKLWGFINLHNVVEENKDFFLAKVFGEFISAWIYVADIWVENFLNEWGAFFNRLNFSCYSQESLKNIVCLQVKNGQYDLAIRNLDIIAARLGKKRKRYSLQETLYPKFQTNNIPIVFNCDSNFVKYFSVALQSIIETSSKDNNYDIILLNEDITDNQKDILCSMVAGCENISIRFYNVENLINKYDVDSWFTTNHINHCAYYRLFIPQIFQNFDKIIYLDCDLILKSDIAELFNIDLGGNTVGAVRDSIVCKIEEKDEIILNVKGIWTYMKEVLGIKDLNNYFNSGVLLLDVQKIISKNYFDKFIEVGKINNRYMHDQNVLNSVLQGDVQFLDKIWNIQINNRNNPAFEVIDVEQAKILHFCSGDKPWSKIDEIRLIDLSWWNLAKKTPFENEILLACVKNNLNTINKKIAEQNQKSYEISKLIMQKNKIKFNYYRAKVLHAITIGKARIHYKNKKNFFKKQLNVLRSLAV